MARSNITTWNREDRDLLVELKTEVTAIRADLADLKGNYTGRLLNLESNAVSKIQFDDHEKRIRFIERYMWMALGILGVAEAVLQFFFK